MNINVLLDNGWAEMLNLDFILLIEVIFGSLCDMNLLNGLVFSELKFLGNILVHLIPIGFGYDPSSVIGCDDEILIHVKTWIQMLLYRYLINFYFIMMLVPGNLI